MTTYNAIVVHYSEIGLKGSNRPLFEKILVRNMLIGLRNTNYKSIERKYGCIIIHLKKNADINKIQDVLKNTPGISSYSLAIESKQTLQVIKKKALAIATENKKKSFKISTKRSDKSFIYTSLQLNEKIGKYISEKTSMKVKLKNPGLVIYIEIISSNVFIYHERKQGIGGLPVGTAGKVIALLSGGIDSPVASYLLMKRGARVIFVHFLNETVQKSENKVIDLVKVLTKYQLNSILYIVRFGEIQKEIIKSIPAKQRMIIYRRVMFRIAEKIAKKVDTKAFVTGDSVAQVASQTLDNLRVIYQVANHPVLAPLIGMNKQEIMDMAQEIGTYETSIQPYSDCCSFLIHKHPETKAEIEIIEKIESNLNLEKIMRLAEKNTEKRIIQ